MYPTHTVHVVATGAVLYLPAMQALQVGAAAPEYFPGVHCRHTFGVVAAGVVEYSPAAQSVQTVCFDAVWYLPGTHGMHVVVR